MLAASPSFLIVAISAALLGCGSRHSDAMAETAELQALALRFADQARTGRFTNDTVDHDMSAELVRLEVVRQVAGTEPERARAMWEALTTQRAAHLERVQAEANAAAEQYLDEDQRYIAYQRPRERPLLADSTGKCSAAIDPQLARARLAAIAAPLPVEIDSLTQVRSRMVSALAGAVAIRLTCDAQELRLLAVRQNSAWRVVNVF